MTERERLIKLLDERIAIQECSFSPDKPLTTDSLADYLLEHGVIVPPCKVGEVVWFIRDNKIIETIVSKIVLKIGGLYLQLSCNSCYETTCRSIGKTVFFTREEAEDALAERRNAK